MSKFKGFNKSHVGEVVTDIRTMETGVITGVYEDWVYPIEVDFVDTIEAFLANGFESKNDPYRTLYFGDKIKVEITGEVVPEPKLICPVCNIEHKITMINERFCFRDITEDDCPLRFCSFYSCEEAETTIKNLMKMVETNND